jgi:hypothetical protein
MSLQAILFYLVVAWVVFALLGAFASRRLLVIDVEKGRIVRAGGKVPSDFYAEVVDVLERAKATGRCSIRIERGQAIVLAERGLSDAAAQRVRNVVGRFPLARLKAGRPVR